MPRRSIIDSLPMTTRHAIEDFIATRGFANYAALARDIEKTFHVKLSRAALTRFGSRLDHHLDVLRHATRAAHEIAGASGDGSAALLRLVQSHLFGALTRATAAQLGTPDLATLTRLTAEIERTSLAHLRRADAAERKLARATAILDAPADEASPSGIQPAAIDRLRQALNGNGDGDG